MADSEKQDTFYLEITFKKSGHTCGKGYCSGNDIGDAIPVKPEIYTKIHEVNGMYISKYIKDDDTLRESELKTYTTEMNECRGSGYCSSKIKVRREAISGKLVEKKKKKKTLKQQYLEMRARKGD